jgi:hypothetical protein
MVCSRYIILNTLHKSEKLIIIIITPISSIVIYKNFQSKIYRDINIYAIFLSLFIKTGALSSL